MIEDIEKMIKLLPKNILGSNNKTRISFMEIVIL